MRMLAVDGLRFGYFDTCVFALMAAVSGLASSYSLPLVA
jgi:hypothetical protein